MDIPTLLAASMALSCVAGAVMVLILVTRRTYPGFGWWTAGILSGALGSALFLPALDATDLAHLMIRNGLIVAGMAMIRHGIVIFRGGQPSGVLELGGFIAFLAVFGQLAASGLFVPRAVIVSLYAGALALAVAVAVLRSRPAHFGANDVLLASAMTIFSGLSLVRSVVLLSGDAEARLAAGLNVEGIFFLVQVLTIQLVTMALLGMNSQRTEHELTEGERLLREREAEIVRAKDFAEKLIESANVLVLGLGFDGRVVVFNAAAEEATGFRRDEVLGEDWFAKVVAPRPPGEPPGPFEAAIRVGTVPRQGESTVLTRGGERRRIAWWNTALPDPQGRTICLSLGIDVTAQREAERELAEYRAGLEALVSERTLELARTLEALRNASEERRAVFDAATVGIVLTVDRVIQRCNRTMEQMFGYGPHELDGAGTRILYPSDALYQEVGERSVARLAGEGLFREEAELMRKDGTRFWCRMMGRAVDPEDPSRGFAGTFEDISSERAAIAEIERARTLAEDAVRTKADFLANMSHEIRTPMNSVMGMTHLALQADPPPRVREYIERIRSSSQQLLRVINDILDFSKIEAGRMVLEIHPFDLDALVERVCGQLSARARAKGIDLRVEMPPEMPRHCVGDDLRLGQVLLNLGGNAVKFTERGEVCIGARLLAQVGDEMLIRFEVRDTGIGLDSGQQDSVFEGFRQVDSSATRRFGGTGLGLAISRRLVEMMGGEIGVDSEPGRGSRFWFTVRMERGRTRSNRFPVLPELRGKRVLVVDDNLPARKIIQLLLQQMSFEVTAVDSGLGALSMLEAADEAGEPYELVLVDWMMPNMGGDELVRRINALGLERPPKCLLVTGNSGHEVVEAAHEIGVAEVLLKPVSASQLFEAVVRALNARIDAGADGPAVDDETPALRSAPVQDRGALDPPPRTHGPPSDPVSDGVPEPAASNRMPASRSHESCASSVAGDWDAVRARMLALLREDDMDCVSVFDVHEALARAALGERFPVFESAMRAFDFPAAIEALGESPDG